MTKVVLDAGAILVVLFNLYMGWRLGALNRLIVLVGTFGAVAAATWGASGVRSLFGAGSADVNSLYTASWYYAGVIIACLVAVEILCSLYHDKLKKLFSVVFDQTLGCIFGVILGLAEVSIFIMIMLATANVTAAPGQFLPSSRSDLGTQVNQSLFVGWLAQGQPLVQNIYKPVLPPDLSTYLQQTSYSPTPAK